LYNIFYCIAFLKIPIQVHTSSLMMATNVQAKRVAVFTFMIEICMDCNNI